MRALLNTLYVQTERAYLHLDHDTIRVEVERQTRLQTPLLGLSAIVCFGDVLTSPALLHRCADDEGEAAAAYFDAFGLLVREDRAALGFELRSRRPPRDPMNALLSFLYTLLRIDCVAALEGVGLDPQVGYLHALRPGRPALALDLMEELRPVVADRLALGLVNRRQLTRADFEEREGGAVLLTEQGRRTLLVAYQKRKQEEVEHRVVGTRVPLGLVPHLRARILARHLRGDLAAYLPYLAR